LTKVEALVLRSRVTDFEAPNDPILTILGHLCVLTIPVNGGGGDPIDVTVEHRRVSQMNRNVFRLFFKIGFHWKGTKRKSYFKIRERN
jgi:hypothetical protein